MMPRHEVWRRQYRNHRYCRHLTQLELNQRFRDVFVNMLRLTDKAKIGLPAMDAEGVRWMETWTHVLEEMALRHGPAPNGFTPDILHNEPVPDFVGELGRKCAHVLSERGLQPNQVFIKYGKPGHMTALFKRGEIRVQCASYYGDAAHNGAVRDDELSLALSLPLSRVEILKIVANPEDVPEECIEQRMDLNYRHDRDYWLFCVTRSIEPRLFVDFNASACVIIRDAEEFKRRLKQVTASAFSGTTYSDGDATYVDPLQPNSTKINIPFSKHFRYAYQEEFRFVWQPSERFDKLTYVDLTIGPLGDIAELVLL